MITLERPNVATTFLKWFDHCGIERKGNQKWNLGLF